MLIARILRNSQNIRAYYMLDHRIRCIYLTYCLVMSFLSFVHKFFFQRYYISARGSVQFLEISDHVASKTIYIFPPQAVLVLEQRPHPHPFLTGISQEMLLHLYHAVCLAL